MTEIKSLSYSKIAALLRCARQFEYRYIQQIPSPLKGRLLAGRVYHHTVATAAVRRQLFNETILEDEVRDVFSKQWDKELRDKLVYDELGEEKAEATIVDFGDDKPEELKESGIRLAQLYVSGVLPRLEIETIEKRLTGSVDGIPFVGYPDLILSPGNVVVDHKTSTRKMNQEAADKDIQFSSYAMLLGKDITGEFHQALDKKEKEIEVIETKRGESDMEWLKGLIASTWQQIQSGIFPPNPTWWGCGPDCEFYLECRHPEF